MKKVFSNILYLALVLSLFACVGEAQPSAEEEKATAAASTEVVREETIETEGSKSVMRMKIGDTEVSVTWEENESVEALKDLVASQELSIQMSMYGGFEQVGPLGTSLPRSDVQTTTEAGDIVLYSGNQIVVFYESNSWAYTKLGHITDKTQAELAELLSTGDTVITLSLEKDVPAEAPVVHFTSDISAEGLVKVYQQLGWQPTGRVAVKISTGEPPASNYLRPELIGDLVQLVDGTIVECNTAYGGSRSSAAMHKQVTEDHGFTGIADFDLLDEEGEVEWPVTGGDRLSYIIVGSHSENYTDWVILSHYKGHQMAGLAEPSKTWASARPRHGARCWCTRRAPRPAAASFIPTRMPGWKLWRRWWTVSWTMWVRSTSSISMS